MKLWNKLSLRAKYYLLSFVNVGFFCAILLLLQIEFINIIFFLTSYVWHFSLQTPGLKEQVMTKHHKLSFLAVVVRVNHYLQLFINIKRLPYASSFIRALSPALFTFMLFILGGAGNMLFTFLGSLCFEVMYQILKKKMDGFSPNPLVHTSDQDTPPVIPLAEKSRE
jgi:hypothetical protein